MSKRPSQNKRIVAALRNGEMTTMQLIHLGICCPTKRISELRREGYDILTDPRSENGRKVVYYILLAEPEGSNE